MFIIGYILLPLAIYGISGFNLLGFGFVFLVWTMALIVWWRGFSRWPTEVRVGSTSVTFRYRKREKNIPWSGVEKIDRIKLSASWGWGTYESILMKNGTKIPLQGVVDKTLIKEIRNQFHSHKQSQKES